FRSPLSGRSIPSCVVRTQPAAGPFPCALGTIVFRIDRLADAGPLRRLVVAYAVRPIPDAACLVRRCLGPAKRQRWQGPVEWQSLARPVERLRAWHECGAIGPAGATTPLVLCTVAPPRCGSDRGVPFPRGEVGSVDVPTPERWPVGLRASGSH